MGVRLVLLLLLVACGDDAQITPDAAPLDAYPDAAPTPAIDWAVWGGSCSRSIYGPVECAAADGATGTCILTGGPGADGVYPGTCEPNCHALPVYTLECPADAVAVYDGGHSQPCHCEQR